KLYCNCNPAECGFPSRYKLLNEDGSPKEQAVLRSKTYLWVSKLTTISVSYFEFHHIPIKTWRFLTDFCGTTYLWISKTKIDVTVLNDPDLSKIKTLFLVDVGLTEMPCLSSLTGLEHLFLNGNQIGEVNLQSYFDAEKGTHRAMPNLKYLDLRGNPIFSMCTRIRVVFTNRSMVIRLNNLRLCHPFSNLKHEMKKARIQPIEPDMEHQCWMS
ncbi:uncharacterized protein VICG_02151, partial [Vittaforma corneae ATCC 50505]